jgi:phosphopantothenoylcysteine decarboxylase/phosphopantothenate--cysteine ligase
MNVNMWENQAVQKNLQTLIERGYHFVEPGTGELACHWYGKGRLADLEEVMERIEDLFSPKDLKGERILVTAGPTQEPIDPVRFITNRSSGKMGYALAGMARRRGAEVILVSGPTPFPLPGEIWRSSGSDSEEMREGCSASREVFRCDQGSCCRRFPSKGSEPGKDQERESSLLRAERTGDILEEIGSGKEI